MSSRAEVYIARNIKAFRDVAVNIFASSVNTISLNLVIYPIMAQRYSKFEYGNILTLYGIICVLASSFGNTLNNTRLILNKQHQDENKQGNYLPISFFVSLLGGLCMLFILVYLFSENHTTVTICICTVVIAILRAYLIVEYRLKLNYLRQLISNFFLASGYLISIFFIDTYMLWPLPFLIGEALSFIYSLSNNSVSSEPIKYTPFVSYILRTYILLFCSSLIGNLLTYCDRFIINPLLGADSVSIFSVASFWGRFLGLLIAPTASVLLSYLNQKGSIILKRKYYALTTVSILPITIMIFLSPIVGPIITELLFPSIFIDADKYITVASTGVLLGYGTDLFIPVILSICKLSDVLKVQILHLGIYIVIASVGTHYGGLMGFSYSICLINIIKYAMYFMLGNNRINKMIIVMSSEKH